MDEHHEVGELFDELSSTYDAVGVDFFGPIAAGLVDNLDPHVGERALDVGCGRGAVLFSLAAAVGESGSVTGIDLSPRMVEATRVDAVRAGVNVDVRVGDAMAPDLPTESFDVIASSLVLFFLSEPLDALKVWRNLLVMGGRVGVSTFGSPDTRWTEEVDQVLQRAALGDQDDITGRHGPFGSDTSMEQLFRDAGYRNVRTVSSTVTPRFEDPEQWFRWSMSVGQRR